MFDSLGAATLIGPGSGGLSAEACARAIVRFEAALAAAQAALGIIPADAAEAIERAAASFAPDLDALARGAQAAGTPVIELLRQFGAGLDAQAPGAREYLHRGATSQDALDTGVALSVAPLVASVVAALERGCAASAALTRRHAAAPMIGRTLMQPAGVITFGFKTAQWSAALRRSAARVREAADRALCLQLAGAVGTGAAFGPRWKELQDAVATRLGLRTAATWQSLRDDWLNLLLQLGLAVGVAGKIAGDVILLGQSEVAEVREPSTSGGRSSAMPHKRNPVLSLRIRGCWHVANGAVAGLLPLLAVEQERGAGTWQAELAMLPALVESAVTASGSLAQLLEGLEFDGVRARQNLDATGGLVYSERAVEYLAGAMRPSEARQLVDRASAEAVASGSHLRDHLAAAEGIASVPAARLESILDDVFDTDRAAAPAASAAGRILDEAGVRTMEDVR